MTPASGLENTTARVGSRFVQTTLTASPTAAFRTGGDVVVCPAVTTCAVVEFVHVHDAGVPGSAAWAAGTATIARPRVAVMPARAATASLLVRCVKLFRTLKLGRLLCVPGPLRRPEVAFRIGLFGKRLLQASGTTPLRRRHGKPRDLRVEENVR